MITPEQSVPARSDAGLAARDVFYAQFNDVNFYIEDETQENLYLELLKRMFPRMRLVQVFALRGKANAIAHARDRASQMRARNAVYILDKDFDDLLGVAVTQSNIFYLDRYCIENYVLTESAMLQVAVDSAPHIARSTIKRKLAFAEFHSRLIASLKPLCRLFFVVQKFNLGLRNCDCRSEQFALAAKLWEVDPALKSAYEATVLKKCLEAHSFPNKQAFGDFLKCSLPRTGPRDANIPGKLLLGFSYHYLRALVPLAGVRLEALTYRLSRNSSLRSFRAIRTRIKSYLVSGGVEC